MEDNNYCVYFHRRKDNNEIIYVGEGRETRAKLTRLDIGKNKQHQELVNTVGVYFEIYKDGLTKSQAEKLEEVTIQKLRSDGVILTNVNKRATSSKSYRKEEFEELFYLAPDSPSGLRWKVDRYNIENGYLLAKKNDIACCKKKTTGYWYYNNKASHRIVYALAHGECPKDLTIDHIDCNKDNNSIENLRLMTRSENSSRGNIHTVHKQGEDVSTSKVNNIQILEIYKLFEEGKTNLEISNIYNLHERYISLIRHGKRWTKFYKEYGKVFNKSFTEEVTKRSQVEDALYLIDIGLTNKDISNATDIEVSTVSRIRNGKIFAQLISQIRKEQNETSNRI